MVAAARAKIFLIMVFSFFLFVDVIRLTLSNVYKATVSCLCRIQNTKLGARSFSQYPQLVFQLFSLMKAVSFLNL